ncbi:MAG: hypothetical protein PHH85_03510 [Candidatus Methanoperedens sp.]|nr:hypothetical protein [Candidatus Methanoperedens sp.]
MDEQILSTVLGIVVITASGLISAGLVYAKTNAKYQQVKKMLKDLVAAIDDDRLTTEEVQILIQDARNIVA